VNVPIDDVAAVNLEAPVLPASATQRDGSVYWLVWCRYCQVWHRLGPADGHREAHCQDQSSPYWKTGYNLAFAGATARGQADFAPRSGFVQNQPPLSCAFMATGGERRIASVREPAILSLCRSRRQRRPEASVPRTGRAPS
jgi:hypothetical protein